MIPEMALARLRTLAGSVAVAEATYIKERTALQEAVNSTLATMGYDPDEQWNVQLDTGAITPKAAE